MRRNIALGAALCAAVVLLLGTWQTSARVSRNADVVVSSIQSTPTTHTIGVRDNYFQPSILQVMPGDTVRWVNQGQHNHTVTTQDGRDYPLARGASIALTFHSPGRFSYHCRFHPLQRMAGVILVGAGVRAENNASPRFEVIEGVSSLVSEPCCEETR